MPLDANPADPSAADTDLNAASSTALDAPAGSSPEPDVSTPSSGDDTVSERDRLLAAVTDAVKPDATTPDTPAADGDAPNTDAKSDSQPEGANAELPDATPEELAAYTPGARKRIEGLVRERNALRETTAQLTEAANHFHEFQGYLQGNGISNDDANLGLGIMAAMARGDFETVYQGLMPYLKTAALATGRDLPDDLAQQVQDGLVSEDAARELSVRRFQTGTLSAQLKARDEQAAQQTQAAVAHQVRDSVSAWEARTRASDPDYAAKQGLVRELAEGIVAQRGRPQNAQQALEWTQEAYRRAGEHLATVRPARTATRPAPGGVHVPPAATGAPKTLFEAAMQGLQAAT